MTETTQPDASSATASILLTFLLADLRDFTAYTDTHGDEAGAHLSERFLALCRAVVASFDGWVFGSAGDQVLAAFSSVRQALRAAVALQQRLATEQEREPALPLQAGIGLDTGDAIRVGDDYRSGAVNLAARLCSLAGPGEIFASEGAIRSARKTEGLAFVDRGEVRLKGLATPVRVVQIAPQGELPNELPALQAMLVTHPTNLPDAPTPFIGREREIQAISTLVQQPGVRLVTLTGPGGTGKTRLALQVGGALLYRFPDGVFFVSLASVSAPSLVPSVLAETLQVTVPPEREPLDRLVEHLREKRLLLVLDNFEHLLDASLVVSSLLDACRELHLLVTSRIPLHLSREHEYPVPPLAVPDPTQLPDLATLSQYEAVALFIQRAQAVKPDFAVTTENAPAVAEICHRVDGLPLALELAAARIKLFPPQALLQRLSNRLNLLRGGARDLPSRQQTLRDTIDWSYSLLSQEEQLLFARLGVFARGCSFEAAEAVCNPEGDLDLLEGMASLVDKSLLRQEGEGEPRFSMLETIREYAGEQTTKEERERLERRHATYFLELAELAEPKLISKERGPWVERLATDQDNLRAGLAWSVRRDEQRDIEIGLRLAGALLLFWMFRGEVREGLEWVEATLAKGREAAPAVRAKALWGAGELAWVLGKTAQARTRAEESVALWRSVGDKRWLGYALQALPMSVGHPRAGEAVEESLRLFQEVDDTWGVAMALTAVDSFALVRDGDPTGQIRDRLEEALARWRALGDEWGIAQVLNILGDLARSQGKDGDAMARYEEALALLQRVGMSGTVPSLLHNLGYLALRKGENQRAIRLFQESLTLFRSQGDQRGIADCLDGVAAALGTMNQPERAIELFAAAATLREAISATVWPANEADRERWLEATRAQLDRSAFDAAWARGRSLTTDGAIAKALQ